MKQLVRFAATVALVAGCEATDGAPEAGVLELELQGRFGSADSALSLRAIDGITATQGRGDTILIVQSQVPAVLMMGSSGDSLGMIGRRGSGPGEFSQPSTPSILRDTIWIQDVRGPILRFGADGEYIDQLLLHVAPLGPFQYAPRFRAALDDGSLLMQGTSNPVGREARAAVQALAYVRVDRGGGVADTVALLAVRESSYVLRFDDGGGIVGSHPAANPDVGAVDPEGRWVVVAHQELQERERFGFTVRWIAMRGDTLAAHHVRTTPVSAEPIRDEWIERLISTEGRPRGAVTAAADEVPFPASQAPALALFADPEGIAWIRSPHPAPDSARWYVVDRDRGPLGSMVLPKPVQLLASRDNTVWGWTRGPYDEPYILKFRGSVRQRADSRDTG